MQNTRNPRPQGGPRTLLPNDDADALLRTRLPFLLYAAHRLDRHRDVRSVAGLGHLPMRELYDLSVTLCNRRELLDDYVRENPDRLPAGDLAMVEGYRHARYGKFVMLRHMKAHTVLLSTTDPPVAYGVVGIMDELSDMVPETPVFVETVLLPARGRITYDGTLIASLAVLGPGIRRGLEEAYRDAKARYSLVTSLPFSGRERPDAERLRGMLSSRRTLEENIDEVRRLRNRSHELLQVYHEGVGALAARDHRGRLKELGAAGGWYAALEGTVVAGGTSREDVERTVAALVPETERELVHIYRAKGR